MDDSTRKGNFAMSGIEEVNERKIFEGAENRLTHWNFNPSKSYNATLLTPRWLHNDTQTFIATKRP